MVHRLARSWFPGLVVELCGSTWRTDVVREVEGMSAADGGSRLASPWRRLWGLIVDLIVVFLGSVIFELILGGLAGLSNPIFQVDRFELPVFDYVLNALAIAAYFVVLIGLRSQTLGQAAAHLRVEAQDGGPVGMRRASIRFVVSLLSFVMLFTGYLVAFLDPSRQTLHDRVAGTRVVVEAVLPREGS
ncbi:RDD family protein [Acidimicrobium ferrooxidans]|nr:RDD family protein [Acidimicrobium ferrooxidans]